MREECQSSSTVSLFETFYICSIYRSKASVRFVLAFACFVSCIICRLVRVCVCLCMSMCSCTRAFMHKCRDAHTKSSSVPADTKPDPCIPLFLFPWGEAIRQSVCLRSAKREGAGPQRRRLRRWWCGGQSSRVYRLDVSAGVVRKGTVTSGILMLI